MKKKWWSSLRTKIIAWSFVPAAIILSAVAWFTFYSYQKVIGDLAIKQDWAVVQSQTQPIYQAIAVVNQPIFIQVVMSVDLRRDDPIEVRAQTILAYLNQAKKLEIFDGGVYFLDQQGKVVKSWPEQPELLGQDWSDTPHFLFMQKNPGRGTFLDLQYIETSGKEVLCNAISLNGPKTEFVGAMYYCFSFYPVTQNPWYKAFLNLKLDPNMKVVDGNNRVIFSADPSEIGKDVSGEAYLQQLLQGQSMSIRFRKGKEDLLVSYSPVYTLNTNLVRWNLVKEERWTDVMRPSLPYRQLLFVLLALGVIVPVVVTAYGVRHITGPIQKLIHAAEQVTAGQFKHRITVKTGDEIETLADQFNAMSAELDESYSSLEKKVADRTRQLAVMNAIISVASHSLDIQEVLQDALDTTVEQMGFEAGAAFRLEGDPTSISLVVQRGLAPDAVTDLVKRYASTSQRVPVYPQEVTTLEIEDFTDETLRDDVSRLGFRRLVYIPLSTKGRELGFFILGKHGADKPSPEELVLLSSIGKQIGVAMENAHLYEQAGQTAILSERSRLARELHDAVTQTLFSASLIADVTPQIWKRDPEEGLQHLAELRQLTRGALAEMRTLLLEMRPESLLRADLKSLLTQLADAFIGRVRIPVDLQLPGGSALPQDCAPAQDVKLVFYRVAQEALNNIAKHSGARQVALHLDCQPGHLRLCIQDDGLGFDAGAIPPGHLGVAIMRERAGSIGASLMIESQPGQGTTVALDWRLARKDGTDEYI